MRFLQRSTGILHVHVGLSRKLNAEGARENHLGSVNHPTWLAGVEAQAFPEGGEPKPRHGWVESCRCHTLKALYSFSEIEL